MTLDRDAFFRSVIERFDLMKKTVDFKSSYLSGDIQGIRETEEEEFRKWFLSVLDERVVHGQVEATGKEFIVDLLTRSAEGEGERAMRRRMLRVLSLFTDDEVSRIFGLRCSGG
ncbi:hypothetical protein [Thermogymnomonas acidicola]|uniref:hypothetical protein n=1 Tax=Thermogymnomonas acidicola TaxID=399579 RepID=UPI000946831E|nr:hypothetical protein [Thermogymnomonas acidicola]